MGSRTDVASNFTISGLLDEEAKTRNRYTVQEVELSLLHDHPENKAYSMEEDGIRKLAESIESSGLTDLPLVRRLDSGEYQLISGHRRKRAYELLSADSTEYAKIPCRVIDRVDDKTAIILLHAANYFTRTLTIRERAAASRALGEKVDELRDGDPALSGMRTEEIKAKIISEQTGKKVGGQTIRREEELADLISESLIEPWAKLADEGLLARSSIQTLADMGEKSQRKLFKTLPGNATTKRLIGIHIKMAREKKTGETELSRGLESLAADLHEPLGQQTDIRLARAINLMIDYYSDPPKRPYEPDFRAASIIRRLSGFLPGNCTLPPEEIGERLRRQ